MENKQKTIVALRKAKTSLEKVLAQVEREDAECFPAIQQSLAIIGLLRSANVLMLESHMAREMRGFTGASAKRMSALQNEILRIVKTSQNK